jgi:hypothetical protein
MEQQSWRNQCLTAIITNSEYALHKPWTIFFYLSIMAIRILVGIGWWDIYFVQLAAKGEKLARLLGDYRVFGNSCPAVNSGVLK